jgi:uncharacterized membrane protein YgcG
MLGFIPGLLHAWYIIAKYPECDYDALPQDAESGRVTYIIVQSEDGRRTRVPKNSVRAANSGYGTTAPMAPQVHQGQDGTWGSGEQGGGQQGGGQQGGEGSSGGAVPPTYAEAVKGDHKVQTRD